MADGGDIVSGNAWTHGRERRGRARRGSGGAPAVYCVLIGAHVEAWFVVATSLAPDAWWKVLCVTATVVGGVRHGGEEDEKHGGKLAFCVDNGVLLVVAGRGCLASVDGGGSRGGGRAVVVVADRACALSRFPQTRVRGPIASEAEAGDNAGK